MNYKERTVKFHEIYYSKIRPIFEQYEAERKQKCMNYILSCVLVVPLFAFPIWMFLSSLEEYDFIVKHGLLVIIFLALLLLLLACYCRMESPRQFAMKLKNKCLPQLLKAFGDIEWRNGENIISNLELARSGLFSPFNRRYTDDGFIVKYKDVPFKICETELRYRNPWEREPARTFKGVVISFKTNKSVKKRTMIVTKGDASGVNTFFRTFGNLFICLIIGGFFMEQYKVPFFSCVLVGGLLFWLFVRSQEQKIQEPSNKVTLEDPLFANQFNVYSSDQVEARYLLTTAFVERFQNLQTAFGVNKAKCSFYGDKIMIAINTNKNLFEVCSLFRSLDNPELINDFYNELSSIYDMIEYFKLDQKIGL